MKLCKYCALGNDYWILNPLEKTIITRQEIQILCSRRCGLGGDGLLYGPLCRHQNVFSLKIFNADGSQAEMSGNGLTIFAQYLNDQNLLIEPASPFTLVPCKDRPVNCHIEHNAVKIDLGQATLLSTQVYEVPNAIQQQLQLPKELTLLEINIGNPHCVVIIERPSAMLAKTLGPILEDHPHFPHKTNVQFVRWDPLSNAAQLEIWERGSGYTLGSGSSACAVAFAYGQMYNLTHYTLTVKMPGGTLNVLCHQGHCSFYNRANLIANVDVTRLNDCR